MAARRLNVVRFMCFVPFLILGILGGEIARQGECGEEWTGLPGSTIPATAEQRGNGFKAPVRLRRKKLAFAPATAAKLGAPTLSFRGEG